MSWIDDLRNIIGKPGGTVLAAGKSLIDAIGHNGTAAQGTGIDGKLGSPAGASVSEDVSAIKGETATIVADTNELQTDWANGGRLDNILDNVAVAVEGVGGTTGVADDGTVNTMVDAALTQASDYWNGMILVMTTGNNTGLARVITDFLNVTHTICVNPDFPGLVATNDEYAILARDQWVSVLIGSNDNNNIADTSTVVANVDGSVLERIEGIQGTAFDPTTDSLVKIHDDHVTEITTVRMQELDAANIPADVDAILVDTNSLNDTKIPDTLSLANINAEVDTVLDTAVPGSPTSDSINERVKAIDDLTQETGVGDLAAILANTIDIETDTNELQDDWTNGGRLDLILDSIADAVAAGAGTTGAADSGTTSTLVDAARTEAQGYWNGQILVMTSGGNSGVARVISEFNATTDTITVEPSFPTAVDTNDTYTILARHRWSSILIGYNSNNNAADTTAVVANVDGSVLERLESLQGTAFDPATESLVKIHDDHVTEISAIRMQELDAANLPSDVDAILLDTGTTIPATITTIDTVVDAIKAVTDVLPDAGALTTIDTNVDDIETDTADMTTNGVKLNAQGKLDVNAEADTALANYDAPTKAELDTAESNIRGTDSDTIKTISDQIDALDIGQVKSPTGYSIDLTVVGGATSVLNLGVAGHVYEVRHMRLKSAALTGTNIITIRLYEEINNVQTQVDSFIIDVNNFGTYHSLMDMFGLDSTDGENLLITAQLNAGPGVTIQGQYVTTDTTIG